MNIPKRAEKLLIIGLHTVLDCNPILVSNHTLCHFEEARFKNDKLNEREKKSLSQVAESERTCRTSFVFQNSEILMEIGLFLTALLPAAFGCTVNSGTLRRRRTSAFARKV